MKNFSNIKQKITDSVNVILQKHNLKVYEINNITDSEFGSDILQILVEDAKIPNKSLDFDILATINADISNAMDEIIEINDPYLLEVASAGIEKEINATLISIDNDKFKFEHLIKGQKKKIELEWNEIAKVRYAVKF